MLKYFLNTPYKENKYKQFYNMIIFLILIPPTMVKIESLQTRIHIKS